MPAEEGNLHVRSRITPSCVTSIVGVAVAALIVTGCSSGTAPTEPSGTGNEPEPGGVVRLITDDSFPNEQFEELASAATGYDVEVVTGGDGGELSNTLVLTQGAPLADVAFGIDAIFSSRVLEHGVVERYVPDGLPSRAQQHLVDGEEGTLIPIDIGATCINIDREWFEQEDLEEPRTYEDLALPEYEGLTVIIDPSTSSTGASFMVGTVAAFGEDSFIDYWKSLVDNGARVESGWDAAYHTHFTAGDSAGTYPIVVSYSSSPAYVPTTTALLETCSSQVEYAGILAGADNPEGARAVVDYMLSREFQDLIPETMWVYPIDENATIPEDWATHAPLPEAPNDLQATEVADHRDEWLRELSNVLGF